MAISPLAKSAASFQATWRVGRLVQTVAKPQRKGTIGIVFGTGNNARIFVNLFGHPPQSFSPGQLTLL